MTQPDDAEPPRRMRLVNWRPLVQGTLRGFSIVELPIGSRIYDYLSMSLGLVYRAKSRSAGQAT